MRITSRTLFAVVISVLVVILISGCKTPQAQLSWEETTPMPVSPATPSPSEPTAMPVKGAQEASVTTPTPAPATPTPAPRHVEGIEPVAGSPVAGKKSHHSTRLSRVRDGAEDGVGTAAHRLADPGVTLVVTSPIVNLRQGPGTGYTVVSQASAGTELIALGRTEDSSWFQVHCQEQTVWVAASIVRVTGDPNSLPIKEAKIVYAATATPTPTPTPKPPQPRQCQEVPIRGFGKVWADHVAWQHRLGCPSHAELGTGAAVQQFQHGVMVWVEQDSVQGADPVYAFFDDGTYQRFGTVRPADPAKVGETPSGSSAVGDKFGAAYWEGTGARVKERLGYATSEQMDSPGAFQQFWYGRMFWLGAIDRIFVLDDYPHVWQGFEDTF